MSKLKSKQAALSKHIQDWKEVLQRSSVKIVKNLENQIPRMISEFKKYVADMETKHKKNILEKEEELKKLQDKGSKKDKFFVNDNAKELKEQLTKTKAELDDNKKEFNGAKILVLRYIKVFHLN